MGREVQGVSAQEDPRRPPPSALPSRLRTWWKRQREAVGARRAAIEQIRSDERFEAGLMQLVADRQLDEKSAREKAARYLDELVAVHNPSLPDLSLVLSRLNDRRAFRGVVRYDESMLERLRKLDEQNPLVLLTGHRSYSDFLVRLPFALRGFEREFRFSGANTMVGPTATVGHQMGMIYIRRGFRDPVYSFVLRHYVGWLAERRSNFLWAIEGTRTRTGKLLEPKVGLLAYVVDAYLHGTTPDFVLVPATVVYEYLDEVYEYGRYARGATKKGESLWMSLKLVRDQRRVPPEARIGVGIGEPFSLADFVDGRSFDEATGEEARFEVTSEVVEKVATEVCRRIDAATPITSVALVLLPLLEHGRVRMTLDELVLELAPVLRQVSRRSLPALDPDVGSRADLRRALGLLAKQELVSVRGDPGEETFAVTPGRHIEAAYYRNGIVHFFALPSILELALVRSGNRESGSGPSHFWAEVERLRGLLAHEFFFAEGDAFESAVREELAAHDPDWERTLKRPQGASEFLARMEPPLAHRCVAPFLESYGIIADGLCRLGEEPVGDEAAFALECLARARQELAEGHLRRPDAVSLNMFGTPLRLARERNLLRDLREGDGSRKVFAAEIGDALQCVAALEKRAAELRGRAAAEPRA